MSEIEFNLLDEPWIRVMTEDCTAQEISLTQALWEGHTIGVWQESFRHRMLQFCAFCWQCYIRFSIEWIWMVRTIL